jgi:hypothetical protein
VLCCAHDGADRFLKFLGIESEDSIVAHDCFRDMTESDREEIASVMKHVAPPVFQCGC